MKEATPPRIPPTNKEPTASGIGEPVIVVKAIHVPATVTLATAAASSVKTTLTLGSFPLRTI